MRLSEILNLRKSYIREDIIFYPISETKSKRRVNSQNSKVKAICLNSIAQSIIQKIKSHDDYVFPIKRRHPSVIRKTIYKIRKLTDIKDFNFHQIRHTTSTLVSSRESLATAKTILGDSDIKTTLKYTHPGIEEQRKGVAKIEQVYSELMPK
jgi:integrase